tara:strand:- start:292 stop:834 length:543 start_codon:yes stop_codon:yes gene_type:complete
MNLDEKTGISIMKINEELDAGPVSNTYNLDILKTDNAKIISEKLSKLAAEKILDNIDDILNDKAEFKDQLNDKATYAKKIQKQEGKIDWNNLAEQIIGKINGLYPNPGAWFFYSGERYKILKAEVGNAQGKIGHVIGNDLEICCKDKSIKILEIQREGKRTQNINEFIPGSKIKKGSKIE